MANYNKKFTDTSVRIGEVRFSYVSVFEPKLSPDGTKSSYSVQIRIPKSDASTIKMVEDAIEAAAVAGTASKWGGKRPPAVKMKTPLRDGDAEFPDDESYAGMMFMNASTSEKNKPGVRVLEAGQVVEALDDNDFYSGCWGAASVNFYAYDSQGSKGIACGLNNVIKTRDDTKFSGGRTAAEDFGDMGDDALA